MNAAEHFDQAELCLERAEDADYGSHQERFYLDAAQAHATLAVAASQMRSLPAEQADNT